MSRRAGVRHRGPLPSLIAACLVAASACGHAGPAAGPTPSDQVLRGGTLRIAASNLSGGPPGQGGQTAAAVIDPQASLGPEAEEILRCCLARTLLAYRGLPAEKGGAVLLPDLARALPDVSADGLTWTFHLRAGLHYAPPLQSVEITSHDVIRAIERTAKLQNYPFYTVIAGYDAYSNGKAETIGGLEAPDAHTLVVHVVSPTGDLGERFSLTMTAPIPPLPGDTRAPLGVATGHDDGDSPFLVSTGPYMIAGADRLDFSRPPAQQQPASGFSPNHLITLVRNPSWSPAADDLRPAYVDRIEITPNDDTNAVAASIDKGTIDLQLSGIPPPQAPADQIAAYRADPQKGSVDLHPRDTLRSVELNLAVPPLDDVHVRRAINAVIDKAKVLDLFGGSSDAAIIGHDVIDSLEGDALVGYDPFRSAGEHGDLARAKSEMAQSAYDANHDGICDAPACRHLAALALPRQDMQMIARSVAADLEKIGIHLDITVAGSPGDFFRAYLDPTQHVGVSLIVAWGKDYFSAADFVVNQFSSQGLAGGANTALLGATPDQLRSWGYTVSSVPNIDDRVNGCLPLVGSTASRCWTAIDEYLTEKVVPFVPLLAENMITVVPRRVIAYSFDQAWDAPALDRIAVRH